MALPPPQVYFFEDQLESATQAWLLANGINDPKKQKEYTRKLEDGTPQTLKVPRVELKYLNSGFALNEHYFPVSQTLRWLDIAAGTFYLKIITRRDETQPYTHNVLRGMCRSLMQQTQNPGISQFLEWHQVEKMIETQSTVTLEADKWYDVSALTFQTWLRIKPNFFPTS